MAAKLPPLGVIILIGTGAAIVLGGIFKEQAKQAAEALADINEGTPFEGTGVVGTLGHGADAASGGLLSDVGSSIGLFGSKLFNLFSQGEFR